MKRRIFGKKNTGRHRGGRGGEDYNYNPSQLASLNLKKEEHAQAVEDWFAATYGASKGLIFAHGVIDAPTNLVTNQEREKFVWDDTLGVAGVRNTGDISQNVRTINWLYSPVIQELRRTDRLLTDQFR